MSLMTTLRIAGKEDARKIENVFMAMMTVHVVAGTACAFFLPDGQIKIADGTKRGASMTRFRQVI